MPYGQGGTPGNDMTIGNAVGGGTVGSVLFVGAGGVLAQDNANFFYDNAANSLTIGGQIIGPSGTAAAPSFGFSGDTTTGLYLSAVGSMDMTIAASATHRFNSDYANFIGSVRVANNNVASAISIGAANDVQLFRDAAAILAQRNGVNPQTFRIYGTTTGPAYLALTHNLTDAIISTTVGNVVIDDITETSNKIFPGTDGAARQTTAGIYAGTGVPNNANGNNGDYYFRADGGVGTHLYFKAAGAWAGII